MVLIPKNRLYKNMMSIQPKKPAVKKSLISLLIDKELIVPTRIGTSKGAEVLILK